MDTPEQERLRNELLDARLRLTRWKGPQGFLLVSGGVCAGFVLTIVFGLLFPGVIPKDSALSLLAILPGLLGGIAAVVFGARRAERLAAAVQELEERLRLATEATKRKRTWPGFRRTRR